MRHIPYTKRAVAVVLVLAMLAVLSLTSCTQLVLPSARPETYTIDDFMVKTENKGGAGQTIAALSAMIGLPKAVSGDVIITEEETEDIPVVRVYNLQDGKLLRTVTDGCPVGFVSDFLENPENAEGIFYVNHYNIVYICNSDGSEAVSGLIGGNAKTSADTEQPETEPEEEPLPVKDYFSDSLNGFAFNGVEYYVRDGAVVYEGYQPLESDYFNASVEYNGLYYYISSTTVFVFDDKGTLLYEYRLPSYAENAHIYVLNNGNIFVQYLYTVIEGEEYDVVIDNEKYKLVSILGNTEKLTETQPILSFMVTDLQNAFTDVHFRERYTEKVNNLAQVIEITNKRVDSNTPAHYAVLTDNLIELFAFEDIVRGALNITRISYDRNLVVTTAGSLLVAGDCTLIGQLNNYRCITESFILTSGAIYDHDLNEIYNLSDGGYAYYSNVGNNIILSKVVNDSAALYLFSGGEPVLICNASDYIACYEGYAVKNEDGSYRYYNENGEEIAVTKGMINWIYEITEGGQNNHVGYVVDAYGLVSYYRLQFASLSAVS